MRKYVLALLVLFMVGVASIAIAFATDKPIQTDRATINDLVMSIDSNSDRQEALDSTTQQVTQLVDAMNAQRASRDTILLVVLLVTLGVCCAGFGLLLLNINRRLLMPFDKLDRFAKNVASGNLDIPLEMDKEGSFGAFTESFDLMRDELRRARISERAAQQSKRELVAGLSHDIQTPVASIKAVAELMEMTAQGDQRQKLQSIQQKAEQINSLVTELFHTTLEELDSLSVNPIPLPSTQLTDIIQKADYQNKITIKELPGCLLRADPVRLAQVLDNIIANSYKYAGTNIEVSTQMLDEGMTVTLRDLGPGADPEELALLITKYFRGRVAQGVNGYGLGLFISNHLMERMGGSLECANAQPGFAVTLYLPFDG